MSKGLLFRDSALRVKKIGRGFGQTKKEDDLTLRSHMLTGDASVVAGSNVHLFEHMAPPQPYGMDNRRDPPYDTSFHGMGYGSR